VNSAIVQCEQLSVELGGTRVLQNIDFTVNTGDFLGIIGPNGGGKTTLLRVILGLQHHSSGTVTVFGSAPGHSPERIGYVPQRLFFDRDFPISVREVVLMGRLSKKKLMQRYSRVDKEKAEEALDIAGLLQLRERRIGALSGGELQRTLIARALAGEPELLLLDEPTASVDPEMKTTIYDLLDKLKQKMTIILVTHDTGAISSHVNRIACLNGTLDLHEPGTGFAAKSLEGIYQYPVALIDPHRHMSQNPDHR
jgi:zinc transport system ATP-binding protein